MSRDDYVASAIRSRADWLEDVLAGLLSNGVMRDEIEVQEYPDHRTVVVVRGVAKYEWQLKFIVHGEPWRPGQRDRW